MREAKIAGFAGVCAVVLLLSNFHAARADDLVVIWGSTTCQKRFLEPNADNLRKAVGVKINVNGVGTGKGLLALIDGKTGVSAASETLEDAIKSAKKVAAELSREFTPPDNLIFHEIMRDHIIPIVHEANPVSELSWEQLSDLHTGRITNWKEVGGPDLAVQVITSHTGSATRAVFQKLVMKKEAYVSGRTEVDSTRKEILAVSKNRGAIGAVSAGFLKMFSGNTKVIRAPEITRPLGLITIGAPEPAAQKMIGFLLSDAAKADRR